MMKGITKIKVHCTAGQCQETFTSMEGFLKHWAQDHLVYFGWAHCHPRVEGYAE